MFEKTPGTPLAQTYTISVSALGYDGFLDPYQSQPVKPISAKLTYRLVHGHRVEYRTVTADVRAYLEREDPELESRVGGDMDCGYTGQTGLPGTSDWLQALVEEHAPAWFLPTPSFIKQG